MNGSAIGNCPLFFAIFGQPQGLGLLDVAVAADLRIFAHVGEPLGVAERERAEPERDPDDRRQNEASQR